MTDSLNVQIAKLLGWTEMRVEEWNDCTPGAEDNSYTRDFLTGIESHSTIRQPVPDYEHSLDASAAVLPMHLELEFEYARFHADTHMAWIYVPEEDDILGEGATRAEALAHALLAWAMVQRGNGPLAEKGNGDER
jgi:predicted RNase H-like HicB family nuclease